MLEFIEHFINEDCVRKRVAETNKLKSDAGPAVFNFAFVGVQILPPGQLTQELAVHCKEMAGQCYKQYLISINKSQKIKFDHCTQHDSNRLHSVNDCEKNNHNA